MGNIISKSRNEEMQEFLEQANKALKESALEARKIAKQTNTPLVIYDKEKGIQEIYIED